MPQRLFSCFNPFRRRNCRVQVLNRSQSATSTASLVSASPATGPVDHETLNQRFEEELKEGNIRKQEFTKMLNKVHNRFEGKKLQEEFRRWILDFNTAVAAKTQAFKGFNYCYLSNYNKISNAIFAEFNLNHFIHLPDTTLRKFNPRRVEDVVAICHLENPRQALERTLKRFTRREMDNPKSHQVVVEWCQEMLHGLEDRYEGELYTELKIWLKVEIVLNVLFETHTRVLDGELKIIPALTVQNILDMMQF